MRSLQSKLLLLVIISVQISNFPDPISIFLCGFGIGILLMMIVVDTINAKK